MVDYLALLAKAALILCHGLQLGGACSTVRMFGAFGGIPISSRNGIAVRVAEGFAHYAPKFSRYNHSMGASINNKKWRLSNTSRRLSIQNNDDDRRPIRSVAIVGGGLAGLSAAYHLLDIVGNKTEDVSVRGMQITVYDKAHVGEGGASSVAGGLIHPFSPRGKLVHFGLSALDHSDRLIRMATKHPPHDRCIILRPHLYRVALSTKNVAQLQHTAENFPNLASWVSKEEIRDKFGIDSFGGLELGNGCKVIHVPSYLRGLWEGCRAKAKEVNGIIEWEIVQISSHECGMARGTQQNMEDSTTDVKRDIDLFNQHLAGYDAVILAAGAGMLKDELISSEEELPVQLVRGQSIEMTLPASESSTNEAFLCGKYVSPLPDKNDSSLQRFVIGATHEFKTNALSSTEVMEELKGRTRPLAPHLWDNGTVDRLTTGVRVQSHRGSLGRMPIVGRYVNTSETAVSHENCWIFTGLSSRGLIYHGLFGRWLADSVLHNEEDRLRDRFSEFDWWRKKEKRKS